jgi:hypothetical protein
MSKRSGPLKRIRTAAVFAANDTWYALEEIKMGSDANSLKLYVDVGVAAVDLLTFKAEISENGTDFYAVCDTDGVKEWILPATAIGKYSIDLNKLNASPLQPVKVSFKCAAGAGSATVGILALSFQSELDGAEKIYVEHIETVETVETVDEVTKVVLVDDVTTVATVNTVDSVTLVSDVTTVATVNTVDSVTLVDDVTTVATVNTVDSVTLVDDVTTVATVNTVTAVTGITNTVDVDVVDSVGYESFSDSHKVSVLNPDRNHYESAILANVTNGTDDTYYYYVDMATFRQLSAQLTLDGGSGTCTVTVEITNQDDGTARESCAYIDVTNALYGAANFTASAFLFDSNKLAGQCKYLRFKVVADTTAANDADWTIRIRQVY